MAESNNVAPRNLKGAENTAKHAENVKSEGKTLTAKQKCFVDQYLIDLNATQAAIRAGYSEKTAGSIGEENLKKPDIAAAIQHEMNKRSKRTQVDADYVLRTIVDTIERCKQAEPVRDREGNETGEYKFEPGAVLKGAELLGKHLKMFTEKTEISGPNGGPVAVSGEVTFKIVRPEANAN